MHSRLGNKSETPSKKKKIIIISLDNSNMYSPIDKTLILGDEKELFTHKFIRCTGADERKFI